MHQRSCHVVQDLGDISVEDIRGVSENATRFANPQSSNHYMLPQLPDGPVKMNLQISLGKTNAGPITSSSLVPMRAFPSMLIDNADHSAWMGYCVSLSKAICKFIVTGPAGNWGSHYILKCLNANELHHCLHQMGLHPFSLI